jgi:hypothetical protein
LDGKPRDMTDIPGHGNDKRRISNLINDKNITTDDSLMWMAPFSNGRNHYISINFSEE